MKNKNTLVGLSLVALLVGGYFLIRKMNQIKKQGSGGKTEPIEGIDASLPMDEVTKPTSPVFSPLAALSSFLTNWNDYVVTTKTTSLNIRKNPDSKSGIVGSLKKGAIVKGKASGVKGWFAVSKDGTTTIGYVNSDYLKAK